MPNERPFEFDIAAEVEQYFDDSSLTNGTTPKIVVLAGGVASAKTTIRKERYSKGYVLVDAADIFLNLSRGEYFAFPGPFAQVLDVVGSLIARRAISERRCVVTEIIGAELETLETLSESMRAAGYKVDSVYVHCDPEQAWQRNLNRGDDSISAPHRNHKPPKTVKVFANPEACGEDWPVWSPRMSRDGWALIQEGSYPFSLKLGWQTERPAIWERIGGDGKVSLRLKLDAIDFEQPGGPYVETYSLCLSDGTEVPIKGARWADWDQGGRLVFARDGLLFAAKLQATDLAIEQLADFNASKPRQLKAPDWAKRW